MRANRPLPECSNALRYIGCESLAGCGVGLGAAAGGARGHDRQLDLHLWYRDCRAAEDHDDMGAGNWQGNIPT